MSQAVLEFGLAWREAERSDRSTLQRFTCTKPDRKVWDRLTRRAIHPKPWELKPQTAIRVLKPPAGRDARYRLGFVGSDLAAVALVHWESDDEGLPALYIPAIAVAHGLRGRGLGHEVQAEALRAAEELRESHGAGEAGVFARVSSRNAPSIAVFTRAGFKNLGVLHVYPPDGGPIHTCEDCPSQFFKML